MEDEKTNDVILNEMKGAFVKSLTRNNRDIKKDRAVTIAETAELKYRQYVENLRIQFSQLKRERDVMLDLAPTTTDSLVSASGFNPDDFIVKDMKLGIDIRQLEIKLEIAEKRYNELFQ